MLTAWIILSLVQGLTEFLPVSSSGHLVLAKHLLNFRESGIEMELWLHIATLVALFSFFWKDLLKLTVGMFRKDEASEERQWPAFIVVSTFITGAIGVAGRKMFVETFDDMNLLAGGFLASAVIILATQAAREKRSKLTWTDAVLFGAAQAVSILPSVSRSGATIAILLFMGVDRSTAFRYSFIASIPAIAGAFVLELGVGDFSVFTPGLLALTFAITFVSGVASLWLLKRFVVNRQFWLFGWYCLAAGLLCLFFR